MQTISDQVLRAFALGLYAPVIVLAAIAGVMLVHVLLLAIKTRQFDANKHLLIISVLFGLAGHFVRNTYYGALRWFGWYAVTNDAWLFVLSQKLLELGSAACAVAALWHWHSVGDRLRVVLAFAVALWMFAAGFAVGQP